jgi:hypothetical protein
MMSIPLPSERDSVRGARTLLLGLVVALSPALASPALGQAAPASTNPAEMVVYPALDQSGETQAADQRTCYDWASQSTGWNPSQAYGELESAHGAALSQATATRGAAVRGAGRGAIAGLAIGAIAGDAGRGAAIGAAAGGAAGGIRGRRGRQAAQASFEEAAAEFREAFAYWDRHWTACMEGNGYVVK